MTVTLSDLIAGDTEDTVLEAMYGVLDALDVPWSGWKPDGVAHTTLRVVAKLLAPATQLVASLAASAFRNHSSGDWLTLVASEVYGVERIAATYASGEVTLVNSGAFAGTFSPGDLILKNSQTNKTYINSDTFSIGANETLTIDVQAQEVGTASNAAAGEIDDFIVSILGVTATNAAPVIGQDEESDADLRARCAARIDALSPNGPKYAYHYIATTATDEDGTSLGITRVRTNDSSGNGQVSVYVAKATAGVSGTVGDTSTPLGRVNELIQSQCVPLGITCTVSSATTQSVTVDYAVRIYQAELTESEVQANISSALSAWFASQPIGGHDDDGTRYLFRDAILATIFSANEGTIDVDLSAPSADVELTIGQIATLSIGTDTVEFVQELT